MAYISDMFILLFILCVLLITYMIIVCHMFFLIVEFAYLCEGKMEILYDD